ncbi:sugar transferase [Belnapia rosea]|uniref:Sugar transferase involved in LPS biosynthesis (Colanic, teichoic acid) n=1 Tax=Belnapia rosea TaxID=938405 RepID=A0A1G6M7W8_9PROT|nr:sugar transferase [Belnapia rosea]SDB43991.1 Sugar transferase involved in LPS biosynthesis (colanic, teichoic acid) [Belnapia rosea]SDC51531.1 Sugar transferase involved in LPS biosynthesis (colanic, teichoic acid) [Belnapia rosea]
MSSMLGVESYRGLTHSQSSLGPLAVRPMEQAAPRLQPGLKRALDIAGAGALLLLGAPVFLLLALLVRADGGPAFYAHERVGRGGRRFGCLKFRSMVVDSATRLEALLASDPAARAEWEATRKLRHDPRITWIGRLLRATSLDELPQLINVLRGDMSLVGPRPVVAAELAAHYGAAAEHYLAVRPGITGLWQVSGRSDTSYAQRVALDVRYATNPSLLEDVRILLRTPAAVLLRRGAY